MKRIALGLFGLLLLAAPGAAARPLGFVPPQASTCLEWRLQPDVPKAGAPKAVVGMSDLGSITVIDFDGSYDRSSAVPRQELARAFLQGRADEYDFIVVFTTFEFDSGDALAFYNPLRNEVRGIGKPVFDNGAPYGSANRLQGIVDMAAVTRYALDPADPRHPELLNTLAHELMHRWAVGVRFRTPGGGDSTDLIGREGSHWSWFVDSDGSVMYGNDWQALPGGRFRSVRVRHQYSALDLYLGGFLAAAEVPPTVLLRGSSGAPGDLPTLGAEVTASGESVSIEQVIAAEGARQPLAADAPKSFRAGFVLLKRPGEAVPPRLLAQLERVRVNFQQRFTAMTGGRGTLRFGSLPRSGLAPGLPQIVQPSAPRDGEFVLAAGLDWLRARQQPDGRFEDDPATVLRDTAYAVMALAELAPNDPAIDRARSFLGAAPAATLEEHAWRAVGLPGDRELSLQAAEALGDSAGFRLAQGLEPGVLDTQVGVDLLAREDPSPQRWAWYVARSETWQGSDGSFGLYPGGAGSLRGTALAIANLAAVNPSGAGATAIRDRARTWLVSRQSPDGGFGASLTESLEVFARQPAIRLPSTPYERLRAWMRNRQGTGGDFGGSVYATSLALLALTRDGAPNLAVAGVLQFDPPQPTEGAIVRVVAVIENRGGGAAPASVVRFFDGDPAAGGLPIGPPVVVPALEVGARSTAVALFDTQGLTGTRNIHALVDAAANVAESSETDNVSSAPLVVAPAPPGVELALAASELLVTPPRIERAPVELVVTGVLRNLGAAPATSVLLRATQEAASSAPLAETRVDVAARSIAPFELRFTRDVATGLRLRVEADANGSYAEADEANNAVVREVPAGQGVDLTVPADGITLVDSPPVAGRATRFRVVVENLGASDAPPGVLQAAIRIGTERTALPPETIQIAAGARVTREFTWTPRNAGAVTIEAEIDPSGAIAELDEANNRGSLDAVVVAASGINLAIEDARVELEPATPREAGPLVARARIRNVGAEAAPSTTAALYIGDPRLAGREIARVAVPALPPGANHDVALSVPALDIRGDTTFYLLADAEASVAESDESDNVALRTVPVLSLADLAVALADVELDPSRPVLGENVTARVRVRNLGQQPAGSFVVRLEELGASAAQAGPPRDVAGLAAGASIELAWTWVFGVDPAPRALRVDVDAGAAVPEVREDNNRVEVPLSLQDGTVFASQRWFSPNGDGVRDAVRIAWRIAAAEPVQVDVRNAGGRAVRRFPPQVQARGEVTWDGRNDRGRIVPDGDYRIEIRGSADRLVGTLEATVDTNRSTAVEAVDTPRSRLVALPVSIPQPGSLASPVRWRFGPRGSATRFAVFGQAARPPAGTTPPRWIGLYRSDTLFPSLQPVVSQEWVRRFGEQRGYTAGSIAEFVFLPDAQRIAFSLQLARSGGERQFVVAWTRVDAVDNPVLVGAPGNDWPELLGALDPNTLLLRWPVVGGSERRLLDLRSGSTAPFAADVPPEQRPERLMPAGVVFRGQGVGGEAWWFAPRSGSARSLGEWRGGVLSPDGATMATIREQGASQSVWLLPIDGSPGRQVASVDRQPFSFAGQDTVYPDQLTMSWVARAGELLVIDAASRQARAFAPTGELLDTYELPVEHGPAPDLEEDATWIGSADSVYLGRASEVSRTGCDGAATWLGERPVHQWFDAANELLTLTIGRTTAVLRSDSEGGQSINLEPTGFTQLDIDLFGGLARPWDPGNAAPAWMFADGSRIDCAGGLWSAGGQRLRTAWEPAAKVLDVSADESTWLLSQVDGPDGAQTGGRVLGSFLNLPVVLRAEPIGRSIRLYGLATDRQFERWELDWSTPQAPDQWQTLTAASASEVLLDDFMFWTPPEPGSYRVRLRTFDRAGNVESAIVQVESQFGSDIGRVDAAPRALSPNGDGVQDQLRVDYVVRRPTTVRTTVADASGRLVRTVVRAFGESELGAASWSWDGHDDGGATVADGRYILSVNDQRFPLLVDNTAPAGAPTWRSPFDEPFESAPKAEVLLAANGRQLVSDANLTRVTLEYIDGGEWRVLREAVPGSAEIAISLAEYAGRTFRLTATDLAGNRTLFPLGPAIERLAIATRAGLRRPTPESGFPVASRDALVAGRLAFDALPDTSQRFLRNSLPDLDLLEIASTVRGLVELEYQTAPLTNAPAWQVRARTALPSGGAATCARLGIDIERCPLHREAEHWHYVDAVGELGLLAEGRPFLVRVVGRRDDGTRVASNWVQFMPDDDGLGLGCITPGASNALEQRLLAAAGLAGGGGSAALRVLTLDTRPPDGLQAVSALELSTRESAAIVLALDREAALLQLTPAALALVGASAGSAATPVVVRYTKRVDGRRSGAVGLPVCLGNPDGPAASLAARITPVQGPECSAQPSGRVALSILPDPNRVMSLRRVVIDVRDPATGARSTVVDRNYTPPTALGVGGLPSLTFEIDTRDLPPGPAEAIVQVDRGLGLEALPYATFRVDRTPPRASIVAPAAGERVCAVRGAPPLRLLVVPIQGAVDGGDLGDAEYRVGAGAGASPVEWIEGADRGMGPANGPLGNAEVQRNVLAPPLTVDGPATLRVRAFDWSGADVCAKQTVILDAGLNAEEDDGAVLGPLLQSTGSFPLLGLSGRGRFQRIELPYRVGERVDFTLTLHALSQPDELESPAVEAPLAIVQDGFGDRPVLRLTWDGVLVGQPLPEGVYALRLQLRDACGFGKLFEYRLRVDRTAPVAAITQPATGASVGGVAIEVRGTVDDPRLARWQVLAGAAGAGSVLAPIADGTTAVAPAARLGSWSRGSLSGAATIALVAEDALDNVTRVDVPIVLDTPSRLLSSATVAPPAFSPNNDGVRDATRLDVVLARAVRATVRVLDDAGAPLRVLADDVAVAAGAASWVWDGRAGGSQAVADGAYRIALQLVDATQPASTEAHAFAIDVDTAPPRLLPLPGGQGFVAGGRGVGVSIMEPRLEAYQVALRRENDGVELARDAGTEARDVVLANADALAEVAHRLVGSASDRAGNVAQLDHRFVVDRTAPDLAFATPADDAVLRRGANVAVNGTVADTNLERWDLRLERAGAAAVALAGGTSPVPAGSAIHGWSVQQPDGPARLMLTAVDRAGNRTTIERAVVIDGTPPVAAITVPASGAAVRDGLRVEGTADDAHFAGYRIALASVSGAGAGQFSDLFDGEAAVVGGRLFEAMLSRPEGEYVLRLTVDDRAGWTSSASVPLRIDTQPPPVPIGLVATAVANRDVALDWSDVAAADLAGYRVYRNGVALPGLSTQSSLLDAVAPEGRQRYAVAAVDHAGNESARSAPVDVVLDRTPPSVALDDPQDGAQVAGLLAIDGRIAAAGDLAGWRLQTTPDAGGPSVLLAEGTQEREDGTLATWDTRGLSDLSMHRLLLEATDRSGNRASVEARVTVDNGPPAPPAGLVASASGRDISLDWSPNGESDLLGYLVYRDGVLLTAGDAPPPDLRPYAIAVDQWLDEAVGDGTRRYRVRAIDRAGNLSDPSAEAVVELDTTPPRLSWVEPLPGQRFDRSIRLRVQSPDVDVAEVAFAWRLPGGAWTTIGAPLTAAPWVVEWAPQGLAFGEYEVRALARDVGGREDPEPPVLTVRFADLTPPDPPSDVRARADGLRIRTTWQGSPSTDVATYRVHRGAGGTGPLIAEVPATARAHEDDAQGEWDVERSVVAVDAEGNRSEAPLASPARIFALSLTDPFTPVASASIRLEGRSPAAGAASLSNGAAAPLGPVSVADDGHFAFDGVPLAGGENRLVVHVTDANGNRSLPAEAMVDRAVLPQAPAPVSVSVAARTATVTWAPRPPGEAIGYRVHRNGTAVRGDEDTPLLSATGLGVTAPSRTIDDDPATAVDIEPGYDGRIDGGAVIELRAPAIENLVGLRLLATEPARRIVAADVEAWSGRRWVRVGGFADNGEVQRFVPFAIVYRTQRVRVVLREVPPLVGGAIAELDLVRRPLAAASPLDVGVPDGRHQFAVSAVERFAFEGSRALAEPVDVGDADPPLPVVLSGSVAGSDVVLQWTASASVDVAAYLVRRDGRDIARIAASAERRHVDAARPNGAFDYTVLAVDAFENASAPSNVMRLAVSATLPGAPQWISLQALPEGRAVQLAWQAGAGAATADYVVERADAAAGPFTALATQAMTTYRDALLVDGRTYHYRLAARDAAGNRGAASEVRAIVPRDATPPVPPVLDLPLPPGTPYLTQSTTVGVCGSAEPDARIALSSDRGAQAQAVAAPGWSARTWTAGLQTSGEAAVSPDGRLLFLSEFARGSVVIDLDTGIEVARSAATTMTSTFAADAGVVWYVASDSAHIRRFDARTLDSVDFSNAFDLVSKLEASPDGRRLLVVGRRAGDAEEAAWLVDVRSAVVTALAAASEINVSASFRWSPDGARVLFHDPGRSIVVALGVDGTRQETPVPPGTRAVHWAAEPNRVLALANDATTSSVAEVELGTGVTTTRLSFPVLVDDFAVDPRARVAALLSAQRIDLVDLATGTIVLTEPAGSIAAWTRGHRLVVLRDRIHVIDAAGGFCVRAFPVGAGTQRIQATARDMAGNQGTPSTPITVTVDAGALPDLAIGANDLRVAPAGGRVGDAFTALVTVRNRGAVAAPSAPVVLRLASPAGVERLLPPQSAGAIDASGSRTLEFVLGALDAAGTWTVRATVDGGNAIVESDESNNTAQRGVAVSAAGSPLLELALRGDLLAPTAVLHATVAATNPGATFDGDLRVQVLDAGGEAIADVLGVAVAALGFAERREFAIEWPSVGRAGGAYRLRAVLRDRDGATVAAAEAPFAIDAWRVVALDIAAPAAPVSRGTIVPARGRIQFRAGNQELPDASLRLQAIAADGATVLSVERALGTLRPGFEGVVPFDVPTTGVPAGVLRLTARLTAGTFESTAERSLTILDPALPSLLSGVIALEPDAAVQQGRDALLRWSVRNGGMSALAQVAVRLRVIGAGGADALVRTASGDLAPAATLERSEDLAAVTLALGAYRAVLEARLPTDDAGTWRLLASRSLPVTDGEPPTIDAIEPDGSRPVAPPLVLRARVLDRHSGVDGVEAQIDSGEWFALFGSVDGRFAASARPLADGSHGLRLRATDRHGNRTETATRTFVVDATPPVVAISGVVDGQVGRETVTPSITITDTNPDPSLDLLRLDGQPYLSGTPVDGEGAHVLLARAVDRAGNRSERIVRFIIDRTAPPLQFLAPIDGSATASTGVDTRLASEPGARVILQVGAYSAEQVAADDGQVLFAAVPLQLGANVLRASATDGAGNVSLERSVSVTRTDGGGSGLVGTIQAPPSVDRGDNLAIALQVRNPSASAIAQQRFRLQAFGPGGAPLLQSREFVRDLPAGGTADESVQWATAAWPLGQAALSLDAQIGGSWQQIAAAVVQVLDVVPPALVVIAPAPDSVVRNLIRVEARATDPGGVSPRVRARIDLGAWIDLAQDPGDAARFTRELAPLAEGTHRIDVEARDDADNVTTMSARTFVVDDTAPVIAFGGIADGAVSNAASITPTVSVADANPGTLVATLDGQPWSIGTPVSSEGAHRIDATATDRAGNASTATLRFVLDRMAPSIEFTAPPAGSVVPIDRVTVSGQTEAQATVRVARGAYSVQLTADAEGRFVAVDVPLALDDNAITAQATDIAGNVGPESSRLVRHVPNAGATLEATLAVSPPDGEPGTTPQAAWTLRNPGATAITALPVRLTFQRVGSATPELVQNLAVSLEPAASVSGSAALSTTGRPLGAYEAVLEAEFTAVGGTLAWTRIASAPFAVVDRTPPSVTVVAPAAGSVHGLSVPVVVEAVDVLSALARVEARLAGGPWVALDPVAATPSRYTGSVPTTAEGAATLEARAIDAADQVGSATPRPLVIDRTPPQVVIGNVPPEDPPVNVPVLPTVSAQDASATTIALTLDGQPYAEGTPITTDGTRVLRAVATDAAGNSAEAEARFSIDRTAPVVKIAQPAPGTQTPLATILVAGQTEPRAAVRVIVGSVARDTTADALGAFSVPDLPLVLGNNTITVSARDRAGNQGAAASVVVVRTGAPAPILLGSIDLIAKTWEAGQPLPVPTTLRNTGTVAATGARFRVLVQTVDGALPVAVASTSADLAAGATIQRAFDFATTAWPQAELRLLLQHDRGTGDTPDWFLLDDHLLALTGSCFQGGLFADGFESGAAPPLFGDGFEACSGVPLPARPAVVATKHGGQGTDGAVANAPDAPPTPLPLGAPSVGAPGPRPPSPPPSGVPPIVSVASPRSGSDPES